MSHLDGLDPIAIAEELIRFPSVSNTSNVDVTDCVAAWLDRLGCETERVDFIDGHGVAKSNILGKLGAGDGGLAYFAHTDVVPAVDWDGPGGAFSPTQTAGRLYGRGSCDMKGSLATMLAAVSRISANDLKHPVYITATADEEVGYHGAREVASRSSMFREMVERQPRVIIGEPTRLQVVHAHKGTAGFTAISHGESAHSSSRAGKNANLAMIPFLQEMKNIHDELEQDIQWHDTRFDPPVMSWNIGVNDHTHAVNIKAPQSVCTVAFRPMPGQDATRWLERARRAADENGLEFLPYGIAEAVYTDPDSPYVRELLEVTGQEASRTVCYGTDGGMFRELHQMVVLGPGDIAQAHTSDEWIDLQQFDDGVALYQQLIQRWCVDG